MPGWMLSNEPPSARAAAYTAPKAEPDFVGVPLSATCPLYSGLSRSLKLVGQRHRMQGALLLGRRGQGADAADGLGRARGGRVLAVGAGRRVGSRAAGAEGEGGGYGKDAGEDGGPRREHGHGLSRGTHRGV